MLMVDEQISTGSIQISVGGDAEGRDAMDFEQFGGFGQNSRCSRVHHELSSRGGGVCGVQMLLVHRGVWTWEDRCTFLKQGGGLETLIVFFSSASMIQPTAYSHNYQCNAALCGVSAESSQKIGSGRFWPPPLHNPSKSPPSAPSHLISHTSLAYSGAHIAPTLLNPHYKHSFTFNCRTTTKVQNSKFSPLSSPLPLPFNQNSNMIITTPSQVGKSNHST